MRTLVLFSALAVVVLSATSEEDALAIDRPAQDIPHIRVARE
jgi:hypothetical protein